MQITDPIADMLTRIRNANSAKHATVDIPASNMKKAIAEILLEEGYIAGYSVEGDVKKTLKIELKYYMRRPVIEGLERVSKPSCRLYCGCKEIPRVKDGLGIAILSSPKGVLSGKDAQKQNVGGEVLCYVW